MAANYPTVVRKFQQHQDGTEYVMAGHMNTVQDELTSIQSTVGVNPHVYTDTTGFQLMYPSVTYRLNEVQQKVDAQQKLINQLQAASQDGWNLPITSVHATGTSIPATKQTTAVVVSDWYPMRWNRVHIDTNGAYAPGTTLTIPKTGWWILTARIMMHTPVIPVTVEHHLWGRMRILSSTVDNQTVNFDLSVGDSSSQGTTHAWHRITLATAWDFYAGDQVSIQCRHDFFPTNTGQGTPAKQTLVAATRAQLTYVRGLPSGTHRDIFLMDDELDD